MSKSVNIGGIVVELMNEPEDLQDAEILEYLNRGKDKHSNLERIKINFDGDNVELTYNYKATPFERIRRITGYLVGTIDRWNDAKAAELDDRVKHEVSY